MKTFKHWGVRTRVYPEHNYNAVWFDLKTIRFGSGTAQELPPQHSEFYDVSLGTKCNLACPMCYVSAHSKGRFYKDIVGKALHFFGSMEPNQKPFQIAIGSESEPTLHPDFCDFVQAVHDLDIVPNYTTNGILLAEDNDYSQQLLDCTEKFCGGVAVSANTFNATVDKAWRKAIDKLSDIDININIHYIISDKKSIDEFVNIYKQYKDQVLYFVILPLMPAGRSTEKYDTAAFDYLLTHDLDFNKICYGAHLYEQLQQQDKLKCWLYPPESMSKNLILDDVIKITASSFSSTPLIEINYAQMQYHF